MDKFYEGCKVEAIRETDYYNKGDKGKLIRFTGTGWLDTFEVHFDNGKGGDCLPENFRLIEEAKGMNKDQLKTGHIVKTRNGDLLIVQRGTFENEGKMIDISDGCYLKLASLTDDLRERFDGERFDIVAVYRLPDLSDVFGVIINKTIVDEKYIIWKREEVDPKQKQLEELAADLQKELKEAEVQLEAIRGGK